MRPAFSIIFFTVMSGFGFGLAALVSLGLIEMASVQSKLMVLGTILLFAGAGLLSSTFLVTISAYVTFSSSDTTVLAPASPYLLGAPHSGAKASAPGLIAATSFSQTNQNCISVHGSCF